MKNSKNSKPISIGHQKDEEKAVKQLRESNHSVPLTRLEILRNEEAEEAALQKGKEETDFQERISWNFMTEIQKVVKEMGYHIMKNQGAS